MFLFSARTSHRAFSTSKSLLFLTKHTSTIPLKLTLSRLTPLTSCYVRFATSSYKGMDRGKKDMNEITTKRKDIVFKENICTVPNLLTTLRIFLSPIVGYLIVEHLYTEATISLAFLAFTDVLDGWIARRFKQETYLGSAVKSIFKNVYLLHVIARSDGR